MQTSNPIKIKRLGDKLTRSEEWKKSQDKWAETMTFAKFDQNPKLAQCLANTKQAPLLECTQSSYWGIGMPISHPDLYKRSFQPKGKNTLWKILEKKRGHSALHSSRDPSNYYYYYCCREHHPSLHYNDQAYQRAYTKTSCTDCTPTTSPAESNTSTSGTQT